MAEESEIVEGGDPPSLNESADDTGGSAIEQTTSEGGVEGTSEKAGEEGGVEGDAKQDATEDEIAPGEEKQDEEEQGEETNAGHEGGGSNTQNEAEDGEQEDAEAGDKEGGETEEMGNGELGGEDADAGNQEEVRAENLEEPVMPDWMAEFVQTEEGIESMTEEQRQEYDAFLEAKAAHDSWAAASSAEQGEAAEEAKGEGEGGGEQDEDKKDGDGDDDDEEDDEDVVTKESQRDWLLKKFLKKVKFREDVTPEGAKKPKYKYSKPNWSAMDAAETDEGWDGVVFNEKGFIQTMALPGCFIKEDVKKMKMLFTEHLQVLDLSENALKGDVLKAFGNLSGAKSGEPDLDACKGLQSINLSGNKKLKGVICEALGKATNLTDVYLSRTGLQGSIADMMECKDLKVVSVGNTEIAGKLADLAGMVSLTHVMVDYSQVNGDIIAAKNWPELNTIYANGKMVTGDIKVFGEYTPKLSECWLTKSNVYGTLEFAKSCPELTLIDIYGTQIGGDVNLLEDCPNLREIYMNYCFVNGDIATLEKNPMLTRVLLDYTYVNGDIKVFEGRESLYELGIAYTSTTGDLRSLHGCTGLQFLNIYGVRGFEEFDGPADEQILDLPVVGKRLKLKKARPVKILKKKLGKWCKITV